jgi:hypothetical protein
MKNSFIYHDDAGRILGVSQTPLTNFSECSCTIVDSQINPIELITTYLVVNGVLIKKEAQLAPKTYINASFFNIRLQDCTMPNIEITIEKKYLIFERRTDLAASLFKLYVLQKDEPLKFIETKNIDADVDYITFCFEDTDLLDFYASQHYGEIKCFIK